MPDSQKSRRHEDWPDRFDRFILSRLNTPLVWGQQDCCLFACDWILEATGLDLAADFRGTYDSAISAARVLKTHNGVLTIAEIQCENYNFPSVAVSYARRGDVLALGNESYIYLGVSLGSVVAAPGKTKLAFVPIAEAIRAWRID